MLKFLFKNNRKSAILGFVFLMMFSLNEPLLSKVILYDMDMAKGVREFHISYLLVINLLYLIYYLLSNYFSEKYLDKFMVQSKDSLNKVIMRKTIFDYPIKWKEKQSEHLNLFTTDINTITDNYIQGIIQIFYFLVAFISSSLLIFNISKELLIYLILISGITLLIQRYVIKALSLQQFELNKSIESFSKKIIEINKNIIIINTYGIKNKYLNNFDILSEKISENLFNLTFREDIAEVINQVSATLIQIGIYIIGVILIINNKLDIASLLAITVTANSIILPIYRFSRVMATFSKTKKVKEKLEQIIFEDETTNEIDSVKIKQIEAHNLILKHKNNLINLKPLNFQFKENEKLLIVGSNGSGKSTLVNILLKIHTDYEGEIMINNNHNIKNLNQENYWSQISYSPQDMYLINDTIKNNIILFNYYDKEYYNKILSLLKIDDLDDNIIINENQSNLSGGQKQKILIARALYKKSSLIILDEPLRNLDTDSVQIVKEALYSIKKNLIIVEHTIDKEEYSKFDKVINLNDYK
ncbi:ABC transporter ATP-binding protein [Anaerococcus nagyae]|uniref:ABC transporter ATP-binding protein n=1 Tax=Anaerococcus nagyae TaxID=1755241 RepID=UPI0032449A7C